MKIPKKYNIRDFPGGIVDRNVPGNARDTGSTPGSGRFHTPWGNSACVPHLLKPVLHKGNQRSEKSKYRSKRGATAGGTEPERSSKCPAQPEMYDHKKQHI